MKIAIIYKDSSNLRYNEVIDVVNRTFEDGFFRVSTRNSEFYFNISEIKKITVTEKKNE